MVRCGKVHRPTNGVRIRYFCNIRLKKPVSKTAKPYNPRTQNFVRTCNLDDYFFKTG